MAKLPGVTEARLNPTAGTLLVTGALDLAAIKVEGRKENYTIYPAREASADGRSLPGIARAERGLRKAQKELIRAAASGLFAGAGFLAQILGSAQPVVLILFACAIVLGGWSNFQKAAYALMRLDFTMSVLMSVAIIGAAAIGAWEEAAVVAFLFSVSETLEARTMLRARSSIESLLSGMPEMARVERSGAVSDVPVGEVMAGDVIIVRPGEKLPLDGVIESGVSSLAEASITGEPLPAQKGPGDEVFASTLNGEGLLRVRVTHLAGDTAIARIVRLVEEAQAKRAPSQTFVERFAAVYTPAVLLLAAAIAFGAPLVFGGSWSAWIYRGLALLVVSCPCALVVSTPVTIVSAIANAARHGVLVKGGVYLEEMGNVDVIAFDKTGTLTEGAPSVTDVIPFGGMSKQRLLVLAASLEAEAGHPLGGAIVDAAAHEGLPLAAIQELQALPGLGVEGVVDGTSVIVGSAQYVTSRVGTADEAAEKMVRTLSETGKTVVMVACERRVVGIIAIADMLRPATRPALAALKGMGISTTVMLTGDDEAAAAAVAREAGIDMYRARLLPEEKADSVAQLRGEFGKIAMVGDGVNDAPALATATVGIAMGGAGTDAALEAAGIVLMADDLSQLPFTVGLSRAALRAIRFNIAFAIAVKLAALLLVFPGWLTLWLAILSDVGASILVTLNGMRLLSWKAPVS